MPSITSNSMQLVVKQYHTGEIYLEVEGFASLHLLPRDLEKLEELIDGDGIGVQEWFSEYVKFPVDLPSSLVKEFRWEYQIDDEASTAEVWVTDVESALNLQCSDESCPYRKLR